MLQEPWLAPFLRARSDGDQPTNEWGRVLWIHPVHLLENQTPVDAAISAARLAPTFSQTISVPGGSFTPGVGWSTIVTDGSHNAKLPMRLLELHWAYHALYLEIDRGLLALLDDDRWHVPDSLSELEADADRVFGSYMREMMIHGRWPRSLAATSGGLDGNRRARRSSLGPRIRAR
jgi:hypothetical protein